MGDSSDDDKPISQLISKASSLKPTTASGVINIPKHSIPAPSTNIVRTAPTVTKKPDTTIESDDDDIPLAVLMKRKLENTNALNIPVAKKIKIENLDVVKKINNDTGSKNPSRSAKDKKLKKKAKSSSKSKSNTTSTSAPSKSSIYYESDKGKVVQALMVRWWYAIQWPEVGSIKAGPPGYEMLDGFPGVYVGTRVSCLLLYCCYEIILITVI